MAATAIVANVRNHFSTRQTGYLEDVPRAINLLQLVTSAIQKRILIEQKEEEYREKNKELFMKEQTRPSLYKYTGKVSLIIESMTGNKIYKIRIDQNQTIKHLIER